MKAHLRAGHVAARIGIGVVAAEVLDVPQDVALPVLRDALAEVSAEPEVAERLALAVEPLDRESLQHDDAAPFHELAPHVGKHRGKAPEREVFAAYVFKCK